MKKSISILAGLPDVVRVLLTPDIVQPVSLVWFLSFTPVFWNCSLHLPLSLLLLASLTPLSPIWLAALANLNMLFWPLAIPTKHTVPNTTLPTTLSPLLLSSLALNVPIWLASLAYLKVYFWPLAHQNLTEKVSY